MWMYVHPFAYDRFALFRSFRHTFYIIPLKSRTEKFQRQQKRGETGRGIMRACMRVGAMECAFCIEPRKSQREIVRSESVRVVFRRDEYLPYARS